MSDWVPVDPDAIAASVEHRVRGVTIRVRVSAADIPEAIRGSYDKAKKRFVIEMRYAVAEEPTKRIEVDTRFHLVVGRHSERLFGIEIDVDGLRAQTVKLEVHELVKGLRSAVERLPDRPGQGNFQGHKKAAERVIEEHGAQLLTEEIQGLAA